MYAGWLEVCSVSDDEIKAVVSLAASFSGDIEILGVAQRDLGSSTDADVELFHRYTLRIWWGSLNALDAIQTALREMRSSSSSPPTSLSQH